MRRVKATSDRGAVSFGQFKLDLSEERLLKKGLPVRLENRPLQILVALLECPDEIVTREELCTRLWPEGTYVDFDEGLNTAIKKLRQALGDSAENPIFIETVPRRGYRFITPVHKDYEAADDMQPVSSGNGHLSPTPDPGPQSPDLSLPHRRSGWTTVLIGFGLLVMLACWLFNRLAFPPALRVTKIVRLTTSGHLEDWGGLASDGSRLYFLLREGDHWDTRQMSVAGGESVPFALSGRNTKIFAVSRNQSEVLFAPFATRAKDLPLWSMPLVGGAPTRVGTVLADSAAFSPDGNRIAFTNTMGVFLADRMDPINSKWPRQRAGTSIGRRTIGSCASPYLVRGRVLICGRSIPQDAIFVLSFLHGMLRPVAGLSTAHITSSTRGIPCGRYANRRVFPGCNERRRNSPFSLSAMAVLCLRETVTCSMPATL
jgi:DNA-binding winged helix-turn-helix (wHTH) protein